MNNISFTNVADHFETYAQQHKGIVHAANDKRFFRSHEEAAAKIKTVKNTGKAIMIIDEMSIQGMGANADNNHRERMIGVLILKPCKREDFPAIDAVINECEQIEADVLSRLKLDREEGNNNNILSHYDPNRYSGERIGPLFDNHYGYMYQLYFTGGVDMEFDENKWELP